MAALSRQMNAFFAIYLPWLCRTRYPNAYTVFAGGDDFFLIGPWQSQMDLARDLRAEFARYVADNPGIHFSAGLSMTKPGLPVRHLAELGEQALDAAKSQPPREGQRHLFRPDRALGDLRRPGRGRRRAGASGRRTRPEHRLSLRPAGTHRQGRADPRTPGKRHLAQPVRLSHRAHAGSRARTARQGQRAPNAGACCSSWRRSSPSRASSASAGPTAFRYSPISIRHATNEVNTMANGRIRQPARRDHAAPAATVRTRARRTHVPDIDLSRDSIRRQLDPQLFNEIARRCAKTIGEQSDRTQQTQPVAPVLR